MGFKRKPPITDEVLFLYPAWWRQNVAVAHSYFFKGETFDEMEKIPLGTISVLCGAIFVGAHFTLLSDFSKKVEYECFWMNDLVMKTLTIVSWSNVHKRILFPSFYLVISFKKLLKLILISFNFWDYHCFIPKDLKKSSCNVVGSWPIKLPPK